MKLDQKLDQNDQNRRRVPRSEMIVRVNVYKMEQHGEKNKPGELVLRDAITYDVSSTGISLLSNDTLDIQEGLVYVLEFSINPPKQFYLSAKLVRSENSHKSTLYKHFLAFSFIFTGDGDSKIINDLAISLFQYKIDGAL